MQCTVYDSTYNYFTRIRMTFSRAKCLANEKIDQYQLELFLSQTYI